MIVGNATAATGSVNLINKALLRVRVLALVAARGEAVAQTDLAS